MSETGRHRSDVPQLGIGLLVAGAVAAAIGLFLPLYSSTTFTTISENTLIQHHNGWVFGLVALFGLFVGYRAYLGHGGRSPVLPGLALLGGAIYYGVSDSQRRLCAVLDQTACVTASPGIGLYVVGFGGALMAAGGWQLRLTPPATAAPGTLAAGGRAAVAGPEPWPRRLVLTAVTLFFLGIAALAVASQMKS